LILVQWSCEVPPNKLESFLEFAENKLKPLYKSFNCIRYELFIPMETKKYFPFHNFFKKNRYIEPLIFNDIKNFEKFLELAEENPLTKKVIESYRKKFNVTSCSFTILSKKV